MNEKDQKNQTVSKLIQSATKAIMDSADVITATQARQLIDRLLGLTNTQKEELVRHFNTLADNVSQETHRKITEAIAFITEKANDNQLEVRQLTNKQQKAHDIRISKLDKLISEIKAIEIRDGKTPEKGVDYFTSEDIKGIEDGILSKVPKLEESTGESIVDKINELSVTPENQIDASHIKNLPDIKGKNISAPRLLKRLSDVVIETPTNNQVLKYNSTTQKWENGTDGGGAVDSVNGQTGIVVLDTGDITEAVDANYVSDAQLVVIGNTSGTNTGDQDISGKADKSGALTQFVGNGNHKVFYSNGSGDVTELSLGADGTFLKSNGASSAPTFAVPAGSSVSFGTDNQIPFMNAGGTDFDYSAGLIFDGNLNIIESYNGAATLSVTNATAGTGAQADFRATNDSGDFFALGVYSSLTTTYGGLTARMALNYSSAPAGIILMADNAAGEIIFAAGGNATDWKITANGHLITGVDSTVDIGSPGALRPRNIYIAGTGAFGGDVSFANDLLIASGGVLNFASGDVTLTHSSNALVLAGGNLYAPDGTSSLPSYSFSSNSALGFIPFNSVGAIDSIKAVSNNLGAGFAIQNNNASGFSGTEYYNHAGSVIVFTGLQNSTNEFRFNNIGSGGVITFKIGSVDKLTINNDGTTTFAGNAIMGANSITMTGSLAATGARVTKGWFTDIESTNMPTVGGTSLSSTFAPIASPTFTGTVTIPAIKITTGAGSGKVLTSDADGDATWEDAASGGGDNVVFVPAGAFIPGANCTLGAGATTAWIPTANFADGAQGRALVGTKVPKGCSGITSIEIIYQNEAASTLQLYVEYEFSSLNLDSLPSAVNTDGGVGAAQFASDSTAGNIAKIAVPSSSYNGLTNVDADDLVVFRINREGANANDTYGTVWNVIGVVFTFTAA